MNAYNRLLVGIPASSFPSTTSRKFLATDTIIYCFLWHQVKIALPVFQGLDLTYSNSTAFILTIMCPLVPFPLVCHVHSLFNCFASSVIVLWFIGAALCYLSKFHWHPGQVLSPCWKSSSVTPETNHLSSHNLCNT